MAKKRFPIQSGKTIRGDQLADEMTAEPGITFPVTFDDITLAQGSPNDFVEMYIVPDGKEAAVQAVIDVHIPDPLYTEEDKDRAQLQTAQTNVVNLFQGLRRLDPEDAAYAAFGRSFAMKNGATAGQISAIVDRPSAASYITGTSFWTSMTVAERQRWTLDKDAEIFLLQILVGLLG